MFENIDGKLVDDNGEELAAATLREAWKLLDAWAREGKSSYGMVNEMYDLWKEVEQKNKGGQQNG